MIRIGIVGAGIRGRLFFDTLDPLPEVEVVGVCDPSPVARAALAESVDVYGSHSELYARSLDAVIIATPDFAHTAPAVDACSAGLDIVVEKPLAMTVEDATAIRDAVASAGVRCVVAFENRWNPAFTRVREGLAGTGSLISQSIRLSNSYAVPTQMLASWSGRSSPGWFLMPHTIDLALWLADSAPEAVTAIGRRGALAARGIDTWDVLMAHIQFADGSIAALESSWVLPDSLPSIVDFRYEAITEGARALFDLDQQGVRIAGDDAPQAAALLPFTAGGAAQGMPQWMIRDIVAALARGDNAGPDAEHGLHVTQVVAAVHASAERGGHPVPLSLGAP